MNKVERIKIPRWIYILVWAWCVLFAPASILAPLIYFFVLMCKRLEGDWCFVYTNRFIEWLRKEI